MIAEPTISREELVARAAALVPVLRERAEATEKAGKVPQETLADLRDAGLLRLANPVRFGGYGHDYDAVFDVAMELGRGCGSTAWCFAVWSSHNWMIGHWPLQHQEEHFAEGPDTVSSTAVTPVGNSAIRQKLEAVDGGYLLSGQWQFSSGCDSASWILIAAASSDKRLWLSVPKADYKILDTWDVSGLRGTGSKDIVVENVFVPEYRCLSPGALGEPPYYGWDLHKRGSYRIPLFAPWPLTLASPLVGIAQGALETYTERLLPGGSRTRSAEAVWVQLRLGRAAAQIDAARLIIRTDAREMISMGERGELISPLDRARYRRNQGYVANLALTATNMLFEAGGGHALYSSDPIQRYHRDANAASHHAALGFDQAAEGFARTVLGLPPAQGGF